MLPATSFVMIHTDPFYSSQSQGSFQSPVRV